MTKCMNYRQKSQEDNFSYNHLHLTYKTIETKQLNYKSTYKKYIPNNNKIKTIKSHNNNSNYKD